MHVCRKFHPQKNQNGQQKFIAPEWWYYAVKSIDEREIQHLLMSKKWTLGQQQKSADPSLEKISLNAEISQN